MKYVKHILLYITTALRQLSNTKRMEIIKIINHVKRERFREGPQEVILKYKYILTFNRPEEETLLFAETYCGRLLKRMKMNYFRYKIDQSFS